MSEPSLKALFAAGESFDEFLARPKKFKDLYEALYKRAHLPEEILARAHSIQQPWHLLVLSEDWCGDSMNTLPLVAKLTEALPRLDMRIIGRDAHPDLMNEHLTGSSKSIPVIILLDTDYLERGWWGPRPRPLQEWVVKEGITLPKDDRYKEVRTWYARDHGLSALMELLDLIEAAELAAPAA